MRARFTQVLGLLAGVAFCLSAPANALESLEDTQLAGVNAQAGLGFNITTPNAGLSVSQIRQTLDVGTTYQGILNLNDVKLQGKSSLNGVTVGDAPVYFMGSLDVGSDTGTSPTATAVNFSLALDNPATPLVPLDSPTRLSLSGISLGASTSSFGTYALEAQGAQVKLINQGGLFNMNSSGMYLLGEVVNGTLFYRPMGNVTANPYLVFDNLNLRWEIPKGTLGIIKTPTSSIGTGLYMASGDRVVTPATPLADTLINIQLGYDLKFRFPGAGAAFVADDASAAPIVSFGWLGALKDARLIWGAGGAWGAAGTQSDQSLAAGGLRLESRWNFINNADATALGNANAEFRWRFVEAGGTKMGIELSDWRNMPGVNYGFDFPLIALDAIPAANGPGGANGGLCWGGADNGGTGACASTGNLLRLAPGQVRSAGLNNTNYDALAVMVRDANLLSYSNKIKIMADTTVERTMNWGLIYTLANLDGNIFFYPGGNPKQEACGGAIYGCGMVMDLMVMSQSFGAGNVQSATWNKATHWDKGTHFMIADTQACGTKVTCAAGETGMGIGLIGASLLMIANDTRIWVMPDLLANNNYNSGIDLLTPQVRLHTTGFFGGGTIPNGSKIVRGAIVETSMEGLLNFRVSPAAPTCATGNNCYLGYSMAARLYNVANGTLYPQDNNLISAGSSFFALSELNRPDMPFVLGGLAGDFAITNGKLDMRAAAEDPDGFVKLRISNDIQFGTTANARLLNGTQNLATDDDGVAGSGGAVTIPGGTAAQPYSIGSINLGPNRLGAIVIPSGQWGYNLTVRPQVP